LTTNLCEKVNAAEEDAVEDVAVKEGALCFAELAIEFARPPRRKW
jgi:hypothetical protein